MKNSRFLLLLLILGMIVVLSLSGCGPQGDGGESIPEMTETEEKGEDTPPALPFAGSDFLTGAEVAFDPEGTGRPAMIVFFSPG